MIKRETILRLPILFVVVVATQIIGAQNINEGKRENPDLFAEYVVIPRYFSAARATHAQGEVVVEAHISQDGSVKTAKTISGNQILGGNSIYALKKWKFNSIDDSVKQRTATITFFYKLIPRNRPVTEAISVFSLPFRIEVVEFFPEDTHDF